MTLPNHRSDDEIIDALNKCVNGNIFERGELLLEFWEDHDYGERLACLKAAGFDWSERTCRNYMNVARLFRDRQNFADLKLRETALYELASYREHPAIDAIIDALASATADGKRLSNDEAIEIIELARVRHDHGVDLPDATLRAILDVEDPDASGDILQGREDYVAWLKKKRPETDAAASQLEHQFEFENANQLYQELLPPDLAGSFWIVRELADAPAEVREKVTAKLYGMRGQAITPDDVEAVYREAAGSQRPATSASVTVEAVEPAPTAPSPSVAPSKPSAVRRHIKKSRRKRFHTLREEDVRWWARELYSGNDRRCGRAARKLVSAMGAAGFNQVGYMADALVIGLAQIAEREGLTFEREPEPKASSTSTTIEPEPEQSVAMAMTRH